MASFSEGAAAVATPPAFEPAERRLSRSAFSWALYQGSRDPYMGLVNGFIFMPYFATVLVSSPVEGQAKAAFIGKVTGLIVAVLAPLLGSTVDVLGARKPWLLLCTALLVPSIASLWFAAPGGNALSVPQVMAILITIGVLFMLSDVLFSSMLPAAVPVPQRSYASGMALSLGNVVSFVLTAAIFWAFALPGHIHAAMIPDLPLLGLDAATHQTDRIVGPIVAITFAIGAVPLFLFADDVRSAAHVRAGAVTDGLRNLLAIVRSAREHRDVFTYLVARTVSQDAGVVLLGINGVYAAGVMHWGALQMLAYGLLGTLSGMGAGMFAAWLDERFGPRIALQIEIGGTMLALIGLLGMGAQDILYLWHYDGPPPAIWASPLFSTLPELVYLSIAIFFFVFMIAAWSSSRTLLVALAPADRVGAFFGLSAFTAATTGWIGPLLVGIVTTLYGSQRAGLIPVVCLLLLGLFGLFLVKGGGPRRV